jgi:hypothetical protein
MNFFKHLYLLYLSFIPALALGAVGFGNYDGLHKIWWFFLFLGVIIYLDILVEILPLPEKKSHVLALASIPVQLGIALYKNETLWDIFAYQFIIQTISALFVIIIMSFHDMHKNNDSQYSKYLGILILLILPAVAVYKIFGPLFITSTLSFTSFFLVTALYTNISTLYKVAQNTRRGDTYMFYILLGTISMFTLGPLLIYINILGLLP